LAISYLKIALLSFLFSISFKNRIRRMPITKDELVRILREYDFAESKFYAENKQLIKQVKSKSPNEYRFEVREKDVRSHAILNLSEISVSFADDKAKIRSYENMNLETHPGAEKLKKKYF
jgi:hypothetical protein